MFDVEQFMNSTVEGVLDTKLIPHPVGEFTGQIGPDPKDVAIATGTGKDGRPWARLTVMISTLDPSGELEKTMGRKPTARLETLLDLTDSGALDFGKGRNIRLGQLREAVGQNRAGAWTFRNLHNQTLKYVVTQEPDKQDSSIIYARVGKVTSV